jgi:hypothetical protein
MFVYFYFVPKKQHTLYEKLAGNFLEPKKMMGLGAISFDKAFTTNVTTSSTTNQRNRLESIPESGEIPDPVLQSTAITTSSTTNQRNRLESIPESGEIPDPVLQSTAICICYEFKSRFEKVGIGGRGDHYRFVCLVLRNPHAQ